MSLLNLPTEALINILIQFDNDEDIRRLWLTCKALHFVINEHRAVIVRSLHVNHVLQYWTSWAAQKYARASFAPRFARALNRSDFTEGESSHERDLEPTASRLGGIRPLLFEGEEWPTCPYQHQNETARTNKKLTLVFQIDLSICKDSAFRRLHGDGILQVFACYGRMSLWCFTRYQYTYTRMIPRSALTRPLQKNLTSPLPIVTIRENPILSLYPIFPCTMPPHSLWPKLEPHRHNKVYNSGVDYVRDGLSPYFYSEPTFGRLGGWNWFDKFTECPECKASEKKRGRSVGPFMQPLLSYNPQKLIDGGLLINASDEDKQTDATIFVLQCMRHRNFVWSFADRFRKLEVDPDQVKRTETL